MTIDEMGEFPLIDRIRRGLPPADSDVIVGIGDDVAVLRTAADRVWLATCDVQIEGTHFLRGSITPRDLGRKALAVNLSDIASAGGRPRFALVSLGLPRDLDVSFVDELYEGLREQAGRFSVDIVGGNMSRSALGVFIDIFLLGEAPKGNVMLRSGARAGDKILVTGSLGDAAAGVALLLSPGLATSPSYAEIARMHRDAPVPRVREGGLIGGSGRATSMIDVSDGLAADLDHICGKSSVSARIEAEKLPVRAENRALSSAARGSEWHFALHGGEDYELLFTAASAQAEDLARRIEDETGTPVSIIGEILPAASPRELVLPDGGKVPLDKGGWDHFTAGEAGEK
jgi:thiamine-monophosphate kinase